MSATSHRGGMPATPYNPFCGSNVRRFLPRIDATPFSKKRAVINNSLRGLVETAREVPEIDTICAGWDEGVLT